MWFLVTVLTFLAFGHHGSTDDQSLEIPSFLKICHKHDPNLNECVKNSIETLKPYLKSGAPELDIPSYDPLFVPEITMNQAAGPITFNWVYNNVTVTGGTNFVLKSVRMEPDGSHIRIRLTLPLMMLTSVYSIDGKILLLPIVATGSGESNITDIHAIISMSCDQYKNEETGKAHLRVKELHIDFTIGHCHIDLHDSSRKDSVLMNAISLFLNDNWQAAAAELKPACEKVAGDMFRQIAHSIFSKYPLDVLLPP